MVELVQGCMGWDDSSQGVVREGRRDGWGKTEINSFVFSVRKCMGRMRSSGTTKPYGNSCFKLKIRRQRGAAYRQTIETMDARWSCALYSGRVRGGDPFLGTQWL